MLTRRLTEGIQQSLQVISAAQPPGLSPLSPISVPLMSLIGRLLEQSKQRGGVRVEQSLKKVLLPGFMLEVARPVQYEDIMTVLYGSIGYGQHLVYVFMSGHIRWKSFYKTLRDDEPSPQ